MPVTKGIATTLEVRGLSDAHEDVEVLRWNVPGPPHRSRQSALADHRAVVAQTHGEMLGWPAQDRDVVAHRNVGVPAAVPEILAGVSVVLLRLVEEGLLVLCVGEAPGDVLVVTDQHDWRPGDADAARVVVRRILGELKPDRRQ